MFGCIKVKVEVTYNSDQELMSKRWKYKTNNRQLLVYVYKFYQK